MSYLLFMDESGHDHRTMPFEVRGGIAVHSRQVWPLIKAIRQLERECFGAHLHELGFELKGERLLRSKNFKFAGQQAQMSDEERCEAVRRFFAKSSRAQAPLRIEFTAFGQACREMVRRLMQTLLDFEVVVFASMIPKGMRLTVPEGEGTLREDQQGVLERYFRFLADRGEMGLLVLDESDRTDDRRYLRRMERFFIEDSRGRVMAERIVPAPMFVASDMSYAIQIADIVIYAINWGFRDGTSGIEGQLRQEVADLCAPTLEQLQYVSTGDPQDPTLVTQRSIFCVS